MLFLSFWDGVDSETSFSTFKNTAGGWLVAAVKTGEVQGTVGGCWDVNNTFPFRGGQPRVARKYGQIFLCAIGNQLPGQDLLLCKDCPNFLNTMGA